VLLVIAHHYASPENAPWFFKKGVAVFQRGGWCGVDLFFVLSGFLISGLLFSEFARFGNLQIGRFLVRRALKIYPSFWCLLLFYIAFDLWNHVTVPWGSLSREFLFITNYWPGVFDHTWSLGVEEHFYLMLPIIFLVLLRTSAVGNPFKTLFPITVCIVTFSLLLRIGYQLAGIHSFVPIGTATHLRCDGLMFGVMISYCWHFHNTALTSWVFRHRPLLVVAVCIAFGTAFVGNRGWFVMTGGFTLISLGFGALLLIALCAPAPRRWFGRYLLGATAFVGAHSYSIYLWHRFAQMAARHLMQYVPRANWLIDVALYVCLALFIGIVTSRAVEIPVLRLRNRFFPSRSAPI
jgi:peptidoglycan/LPS O-acetylase OafA/YrhL